MRNISPKAPEREDAASFFVIFSAPPKSPHSLSFTFSVKRSPIRHPAWGYSQNTTEGRKPLCCVPSTEFSLAAGDNLVLEVGISGFFVVPHDAVLHRQVFELAVVADSHVRADGAVLDGDVLPDDARGNQPGIVNGIPLVDGGATDVVEFVLVLQQPHPEIGTFPGQGRGRALAA